MVASPVYFLKDGWADLVAQLPVNLDELAHRHGILKYHRAFEHPEDLLRLAMAYSTLDLSLRSLAAWAPSVGVCAPISDVAILWQLQKLPDFLRAILGAMLASAARPENTPPGFTLVDGTSFRGPGGKGSSEKGPEWRINVAYAAGSGHSIGVQLVPATVGEAIDFSTVRAGDLVVGDRHYGKRKVLCEVIERGADVVCRVTRDTRIRVGGKVQTVLDRMRAAELQPGERTDEVVDLVTRAGTLRLRLIIVRKTRERALREIKRAARKARNRHRSEAAIADGAEAAEHLALFTTLTTEEATTEEVIAAYRHRWQIELLFKRWKSLLDLDALRAKGKLAETYILGKLLAAMLIEAALTQAAFSPWGATTTRSPNRLRLTRTRAPRD